MIDLGITAEHVVEAAKRPSRKPKPPSDPSGTARRGEYAAGGSLPVGTADKPLAGGRH